MSNPIPVPSQVLPSLPPEVDAWWMKAASRDPAARFQTAKELSDALGVALKLERPAAVAVAPAGMRPLAMSDDGLSVSGPGIHESRANHEQPSSMSRNAKLTAFGLVGVVAMTMVALLGKSPSDSKAPSAALAGAGGCPSLRRGRAACGSPRRAAAGGPSSRADRADERTGQSRS